MSRTLTVSMEDAVGMILAHDVTEVRKGEFKGRAFKKGHIVDDSDIDHLKRLGKEHLFVLDISHGDMHEDDAAIAIANALIGGGVKIKDEPKEGKIDILASRDGLLKIQKEALKEFNMLGDVMCSTLHTNTVVKKDQMLAGTRAIPLIISRDKVERAVNICKRIKKKGAGVSGLIEVKTIRKPRVGLVITGNEVYYGRIKDQFEAVIRRKIGDYDGEVINVHFAPDDSIFISDRLKELIGDGVDLLITTGGMSVDPDDVTRYAIRDLGISELYYGSSVLPGAMFLVAYYKQRIKDGRQRTEDREQRTEENHSSIAGIPILGIPACGMYHKTTVFDLVLPRILSGEHIGREELAEMGHGGYCMNCKQCHYPICPFGK